MNNRIPSRRESIREYLTKGKLECLLLSLSLSLFLSIFSLLFFFIFLFFFFSFFPFFFFLFFFSFFFFNLHPLETSFPLRSTRGPSAECWKHALKQFRFDLQRVESRFLFYGRAIPRVHARAQLEACCFTNGTRCSHKENYSMFRQNSSRQNFVESLIVVLWLELCFQVPLVPFEFSVYNLERSKTVAILIICVYTLATKLLYMKICLIILV